MSDTVTVYHPTIARTSATTCPRATPRPWYEQGWLKTEPKVSKAREAREAAEASAAE
jgi:hypothetical protein